MNRFRHTESHEWINLWLLVRITFTKVIKITSVKHVSIMTIIMHLYTVYNFDACRIPMVNNFAQSLTCIHFSGLVSRWCYPIGILAIISKQLSYLKYKFHSPQARCWVRWFACEAMFVKYRHLHPSEIVIAYFHSSALNPRCLRDYRLVCY